jgi:glutamine synthetase
MTLAQRCGAHSAARAEACTALLQRLRASGTQQLRVAWADLHGTLRGKTLVCSGEFEAVREALDEGIGLVSTVLLKDSSDRTAFAVFEPGALDALPGFGAANNLLLLPDPASLLELPWAPGTAWLRADTWWDDGSPVAVDPRRVLQAALARLAAAGFGLRCGLEVEFHIHRIADTRDAAEDAAWPAEPPALRLLHPGYQLLSEAWADLADEALAIVQRTLRALGLPLRSLEVELGPSQFEAVLAPTDALTAADHMILLRNGLRQALRRAGFHASFVCRPPLPGAVASGWHLHHSLLDDAGGNAMQRARPGSGDARQVLSDAGAHWLAGLLAHARGMTALCAPTIPAYSRYHGSVMAPQSAVWGRDNRGALLRVLGTPGSAATRIENRLAEPLANPYLMIAAHIHAGLDGLQRRLDPGPATLAAYAEGAPALPASLGEALDALAADEVLQQGLGAPMARVFDAVKRQELARHAAADDKALWERREYFSRF